MTKLAANGLAAAVMLAAVATYAWRSNPPGGDQTTECQGHTAVKPSDVPENVLLQVQVIDPRGRPAGYRIYRDGRYESRSRDTDWAAGAAMTPSQLDSIRAAMEKAEPDRLLERYEPERRTGDDDQNTIQVDFGLDRGLRRVTVVRPCTVATVDGFIQRMAEIFKQPNG